MPRPTPWTCGGSPWSAAATTFQNIGIFLWSLNAYSLTASPAVAAAGNTCFRFSSLGRDMPLFNHPVSQGSEITAPARPVNVPDVLLRPVLCSDIRQTLAADPAALNYDPGNSLALYIDGSLVVPSKIQVCDLSGDDGSWNNQPPAGSPFAAAIDPELGRIAVPPPGPAHSLTATFYYGFNADMGGGEYPRADTFAASPEQAVVRVPGDYPTIHEALGTLPGDGVVEITDSGRYAEPAGLGVVVKANGHIELRAADGCRPTLVLGEAISVTGGAESLFDLNGLVVTYAPPSAGAPLPPALRPRDGWRVEPAEPSGTDSLHPGSGLGLDAAGQSAAGLRRPTRPCWWSRPECRS